MKIQITEDQYRKLKRQKTIDRILDKISSQGIESLDDYEIEILNSENNPDFNEKNFLISKFKNIVNKYGNIFLEGLTDGQLPIYKTSLNETQVVSELSQDFVNIISYGGPDGKTELVEYPVNYEELDLFTLKSIDEVINDYEYGE
jgi:hypothetical protein